MPNWITANAQALAGHGLITACGLAILAFVWAIVELRHRGRNEP